MAEKGASLRRQIEEELRRRDWTPRGASLAAGMNENAIGQILAGKYNPSPAQTKKLGALFGWAEDYALELAGHRTPQPPTDVEQVTAALMRLGWPPEVKQAHAQLLRVADAAMRADTAFQRRFEEAVEWAITDPVAALEGTFTSDEARAVFITQVTRRLFGDARAEG